VTGLVSAVPTAVSWPMSAGILSPILSFTTRLAASLLIAMVFVPSTMAQLVAFVTRLASAVLVTR